MPTLICYDITKNTLRARLAKKIIAAGLDRINKSVYLGTISNSSLKLLEKELATDISNKGGATDSVIVIPVSRDQIYQMQIFGFNELDKDELTGEKSTLIY